MARHVLFLNSNWLAIFEWLVKLQKSIATLLMLSAGFFGISAWASDTLAFHMVNRTIPERGQVNAVEFGVGQQKVSLILPRHWRVGQAGEGLVLQASDFTATFSIKSFRNSDFLLREIKESLVPEGAKVVFSNDYAWTTGLGEATVIDAQSGENKVLPIQTRTYIVKLEGHTLVMTLTAASVRFEKAQLLVSSMMASLRAD